MKTIARRDPAARGLHFHLGFERAGARAAPRLPVRLGVTMIAREMRSPRRIDCFRRQRSPDVATITGSRTMFLRDDD
jgi:hypothetical protein